MSDIKVCKFSGAIFSQAENIEQLKEIIVADKKRRIIIVAAPGKTDSEENITDLLISCAQEYVKNRRLPEELIHRIENRFLSLYKPFNLEPGLLQTCFQDLRKRINNFKRNKLQYIDNIKSSGEEYNARLIAEYLKKARVPCRYVDPKEAGLFVTEDFGNALVLESSYDRLKNLQNSKEIVIFPGFYGYTKRKHIATFKRGGNDMTAAILANAVDALLYENFIDYAGLYAIDRDLVSKHDLIDRITYQELRELTYAGFRTFHEELLYPVLIKGIPMHLIDFYHVDQSGTLIVKERKTKEDEIVGIAHRKGFCTIHIEKYMMNYEKGFGRRLLEIIERHHLSYEHSPSGIDSISIILKQEELPLDKIRKICMEIYKIMKADNVYFNYKRALVSVVGRGVRNIRLLSRMFQGLARGNINVEMIIKGGSELSMILCVEEEFVERCVRVLYDVIKGPRLK
ncbi:MAG: aspartate kinase [Spirochaetes bacterium]|nr:aspartate kinase [Spirochaetota bacterium]